MKKLFGLSPLIAGSIALNGIHQTIILTSRDFKQQERLAEKFVHKRCGGNNKIPSLQWSNIPQGTKSLALIMDDPQGSDENGNPWVHWIVFNIPMQTTSIDASTDFETLGARYGQNTWGDNSYGGPCPPPGSGIHNYRFTLYALDITLDLGPEATANDVYEAMKDHILGYGQIIGTYSR